MRAAAHAQAGATHVRSAQRTCTECKTRRLSRKRCRGSHRRRNTRQPRMRCRGSHRSACARAAAVCQHHPIGACTHAVRARASNKLPHTMKRVIWPAVPLLGGSGWIGSPLSFCDISTACTRRAVRKSTSASRQHVQACKRRYVPHPAHRRRRATSSLYAWRAPAALDATEVRRGARSKGVAIALQQQFSRTRAVATHTSRARTVRAR
jgi:hypothetical protein